MRGGKTHIELDERSEVTAYGGLDLAAQLASKLGVAKEIDDRVKVLKVHRPYHESDHVLAQAYNLYAGGTCIEDLANLQNSEAVRRMVKAERLPDPTTAGDFLRRFDDAINPGSLQALREAGNRVQSEAWKRTRKKRRGRWRPGRKRSLVRVDLDGKLKELHGSQKEGEFSYKGKWSLHPLVASLPDTGEILAIENRLGNARSSDGAAELLRENLPRVKTDLGEHILVGGDSDFDRADVREACEETGAYFAFVAKEYSNRRGISEEIAEDQWIPFQPRAARAKKERAREGKARSRRRKKNRRRARAAERNYKALRKTGQWVTELELIPPSASKPCRLIIRRERIESRRGQQLLFEEFRYRYILTDLPTEWSSEEVVDVTYQRCDQENIIEQLGSGVAAWRMPVAEFAGNCAWLEIARLAWNLGKWVAQLALPEEVIRWKWKRFRQAFVTVPAEVIKRGRQIWIRISASHRYARTLLDAHVRLQT